MARIIGSKNVLGGRKRISGTRISVDLIYNYVRDNNVEQIPRDYPHLNKNHIKAALDYIDRQVHTAKEYIDATPA